MVAERDADKGGKYACGNHEKGQSGMPAAFVGSVRTASPHNHQYGCQTVRNGVEQTRLQIIKVERFQQLR